MQITRVNVYLLRKPLTSTMRISRGGFTVRTHAIVEVQTDEGITGLGEGVGNAAFVKAIIEAGLGEAACGFDPFDIQQVRQRLMDGGVYAERKGSVICAASAIEMACWDIMGKCCNVPVYQLLGGRYRETLEAYASDVYWEQDPKIMGKNVERILGKGFRAIKAHVGCATPEAEVERIKLLREVAGHETLLMIDLNAGYTALTALRAARLWERFGLHWLEEPMSPEYAEAWADLRSRTAVPIAGGENEFRIHGFKELFDRRAVDVAMPDIGRVGGIQEAKDICLLAETYGIPVSPHNFSSGVLLAATIHLMASTPNTTLLEMDSSKNAIYEELLVEPLKIHAGCVTVPQQPGLGVHLPKEIIRQYAI